MYANVAHWTIYLGLYTQNVRKGKLSRPDINIHNYICLSHILKVCSLCYNIILFVIKTFSDVLIEKVM